MLKTLSSFIAFTRPLYFQPFWSSSTSWRWRYYSFLLVQSVCIASLGSLQSVWRICRRLASQLTSGDLVPPCGRSATMERSHSKRRNLQRCEAQIQRPALQSGGLFFLISFLLRMFVTNIILSRRRGFMKLSANLPHRTAKSWLNWWPTAWTMTPRRDLSSGLLSET